MSDEIIDIPKVSIRPIDCLSEAKELVTGQYWLFVGIVAVGMIIGTIVPFNILLGPMLCGIYLCLFQRSRGEKVKFETLFKGFDHFVESLIATLIVTVAMLILLVPMYLLIFLGVIGLGASERDALPFGLVAALIILYFFILLLALLIGVLFCFTYPLIIDRGLKAVPALKTSFRAATANFGGLLCLILLIMVITVVAAIFCYLPVFLVAPITFGSIAIAYRRVFPEKHDTEEP